jgi:murein DD-endopeptidase MepM/ murein hydrolase activator NlpD
MTSNNKAGYFPVISVCDGVVDKIGWLELGGCRVGILSESGVYYYYAHLDSYAYDIKEGEKVVAGQLLGFMGDTGYGKEGTKGKFDVHLHFGIYLIYDNSEYPINPYEFLANEKIRRIRYEK